MDTYVFLRARENLISIKPKIKAIREKLYGFNQKKKSKLHCINKYKQISVKMVCLVALTATLPTSYQLRKK